MSALIEFECQPPVGGYDIVAFDQRKAKEARGRRITLATDATEDEQYLAERWGSTLIVGGKRGVVYMLRPRSERTRRFNLFDRGSSAFLELAQAATYEALDAYTKGDNDAFFQSVKRFADRYGLLEDDKFSPSMVIKWWHAISEMRQAVIAWEQAERKSDYTKVLRILEERARRSPILHGPGLEAKVLLKKDPATAAARLCIRPSGLLQALWTQLALAIDGNLNIRACIECRSWFTLEAGRGRSDKEYCSNACRMRAYRKRKAKYEVAQ